jgi:hypothetical protein
MRDTVIGIERLLGAFIPNMVECDNCGITIIPRKEQFIAKKVDGIWYDAIVQAAIVDHDWSYINGEHLCPQCTKHT